MILLFFSLLLVNEENEAVESHLKFCYDVLFEVLRFGDRRRLTKLEGVGRRFHHLVEKWFVEMPFLRLNIQLQFGFAFFIRHKLKFIINNFIFSKVFVGRIGSDSDQKEISLPNLAAFPPFIRFHNVILRYNVGLQLLLAKCRLFDECLNSIKPALKDSNEIRFVASIDHADPSHFSDYSSVVIYLCYGLLPIFNSSRRYNFVIKQDPDKNSATDLISSILEISQFRRCSHVSIKLFGFDYDAFFTQLPFEDISNWLTAKTDEIYGKKHENKFLQIYSNFIQNTQELWEHLKEVNLIWVQISILFVFIRNHCISKFHDSNDFFLLNSIFFHFYDFFDLIIHI